MTKHTSALILSLAIMLALFVYGCCSSSSDGIFVKPQGDNVVTSREVIIDELGRLPTVTFPSGAKIEGLEENTLTPGIVVSIVEQKTTAQNAAYFGNSGNLGVYLYKITAFMNPTNSVGAKTYVTTTEKPVKITLPKPQDSDGIILAGIKESDTDPWRLFNFSDQDDLLANIAGIRAVATDENTFSLFRFGTQFALVSYESNSGNRLPETYVTALNASSTPSILVKDGKYLEDLTIKGIIKGVKLDSIKPTDLRARITYRNNVADEAPIKVNGVNITQTSKADKTVPGYSYCHSFLIDSVSESNLMGNSGEFAFTLDLDGIETQSFSNGFLIEFFNKVDSEKVMPYNYTEFYTINNKDVVTLTITANGGNPDGLYELDPTFVINIGAELSDSDRQKIESAISVTGIEPGKITKVWNDSGLTIGFTEDLEPDTDYTLKIADVTDIDGISITDVEDLTFKTKQITPITTYAITYNLDGGTADNPTTYSEASSTFTLTNPTKTGYTFIGWSGTGLTGNNNLTVTIEQGSTGDRTYTANWSENPPDAYTLVLNKGAGVATVTGGGSYMAGVEVTASCTMLDGYEFANWSGDFTTETITMPENDVTMMANALPIVYNIAYNLDGGTVATPNPTNYDVTSATITLNPPTRAGYAFAGWTGSNGDEPQITVSIEQGSTGDKAYTAHWSEVAYTITYNLDGGKATPENPAGYNIASETFMLINPIKEGYTFVGWSGTEIDGIASDVTIIQGSTGNREYTANWSINSYRLDIIAGTGINTVTGDGMHEYDSSVTASCTMLAGYEFDKWTGDITTETFNMPASNATIIANSRPIVYNITYEGIAGATFATANPTTYDVTSATINLTNPTKDGYTFTGWSGTNLIGDNNMTVSITNGSHGDKTYTAHFTPISYTIAYTMNDGNVATPNPESYDITSATINLINPTKDYYDFIGWSGTDLEGNNNTSVIIPQGSTGNREYTANFTPTIYIITYNLEGGSATNPTTYDVTSATINLTNPTKNGYTFTGWSGTGLTGNDNMVVSIPNGSHEAKEYTAHWSLVNYTITCNIGDGTLATANPATYDVTSATITLNNPTANQMGYEFIGWTGSNGDTPQTTVTIPSGSYGNKVYTANYGLIVYDITYDLNGGYLESGQNNPTTYDITSATITLYNPVKDGHYFAGWTEGTATFQTMLSQIPEGSTGDKSYTAHWIEVITFNLPNGVTLVMHKIPAGVFTMGSPTDELGRQSYETQHQVTLTKAFYIGRLEVTQDQYFAVMGTNPSDFKEGAAASARPTTSANYPVEKVSYTTARTFCASLTTYLAGHIPTGFSSFDLPTEAQWEYACRAGTTTALNNNKNLINASALDSNLSEVAWYYQNWGQSNSKTHTVGEKLPNAWGLYDMHGNVREWCLDCWYGDYPTTAVVDPAGADSDSPSVDRGGSWRNPPSICRSASRGSTDPSNTSNIIGFRLVLVPAP